MNFNVTRTVVTEVEFTISDALRIITSSNFKSLTRNEQMAYLGTQGPAVMAYFTWNNIECDVIQDDDGFEFHFHDVNESHDTRVFQLNGTLNEV